jgi:hypothetical protein
MIDFFADRGWTHVRETTDEAGGRCEIFSLARPELELPAHGTRSQTI